MKVGVITFHSANNYGATLQTWALQKVLKGLGVEAGVINYHPDVIDILYDPMQLSRGMKRYAKMMKIALRRRESLVRYNRFQKFLHKNFNLIGDFRSYKELAAARLGLDAYIVGSDQVWNPTHIGGYDPAYYLEFAEEGSKRLSYAASIGSDYINPKYEDKMKKALADFSAISVRERSIQDAISRLSGKQASLVLDPTLLLSREDYDEIKVKSRIKEPYILLYMIEKNPQVISLANKLSVSLGMPVIQRRPTKGLTNELPPFYTADAGQFLGLIEGASVVVSNSFHGTVFSIIYGKPFISMLHSDTGSRVVDLLTELGLQSHILYDLADFDDFSKYVPPDKGVETRLAKLRQESLDFLKKSLFEA